MNSTYLTPTNKLRLAMVGTGNRALSMWGLPLIGEQGARVEFVGLCDSNPGRVDAALKMMRLSCAVYTDFGQMMRAQRPELLIVCTPDNQHHEYIIRGMEYGADIICEKPMTTDAASCMAILDAERRTGKKLTVAFNCRYAPRHAKIYELLRAGVAGTIYSVGLNWQLDEAHGAEYFRRWHRHMQFSGSLLVHKSTHHFDLLNWWLASEPVEVTARGSLNHFSKNNSFRFSHCRPCPHQNACPSYKDITRDEVLASLYVNNEQYDGYLRDGCVWDEDIDIFDNMKVQLRYASGVQVDYSLNAAAPMEGYHLVIEGSEGRIEASVNLRQAPSATSFDTIVHTALSGATTRFRIPNNEWGHGGGDARLRNSIFSPGAADSWGQGAGSRAGAVSCLTGIAAVKSIETGGPVTLTGLGVALPLTRTPLE